MKRALVVLFIGVAFLFGSQEVQANKFAKALMKKGDKFYKKRASKGKAEKSKDAYEKVLAVQEKSWEARWKLGRVLYWIGTHTDSDKENMKIFELGIRYCQEAIKLNDKCVACHFWLGVSYGKYGEAKGILQSLGLVPHLKEAMNFVKKKKPEYEGGGANRVLGRLYFKLPGVKGGDNKRAIKLLKKAVQLGPKHLMNHRFLAEVYMAEGMKKEAKETLKFIIDFPEKDFMEHQIPEMKEEQETARKLWLKHWKKYW